MGASLLCRSRGLVHRATYTAGVTGILGGVNLDIGFCGPSQGCSPISDTTFPMQISIYNTVNGLPATVLGSTTLPPGQGAPLSLLITFPQVITLGTAVGKHRQGYDLQLTQYDERGWRATFYTTGMEHSPTSAIGTSWEKHCGVRFRGWRGRC